MAEEKITGYYVHRTSTDKNPFTHTVTNHYEFYPVTFKEQMELAELDKAIKQTHPLSRDAKPVYDKRYILDQIAYKRPIYEAHTHENYENRSTMSRVYFEKNIKPKCQEIKPLPKKARISGC